MTLARKFTLSKKPDINLVLKKGKSFSSASFTLRYLKNPDSPASRFCFIVSTKISKHATIRNKAKRALSEGVRRYLYDLNSTYDCVFLAKPIITKKYTNELMQEVSDAFLKAGLIK